MDSCSRSRTGITRFSSSTTARCRATLLVGAGNVGTAVSVLVAPPLALWLGWKAVYCLAAGAMLLPMLAMMLFAKEPDDVDKHAGLREHIACLFEKDGWVFSLIYGVTFGGFIGLITFPRKVSSPLQSSRQ